MKIPNIPKPYYWFSAIGTSFGVVILLKDYMGGNCYDKKEEIHGKTVIITGANTGLGKATAEDLALRGGKIIMACRDMNKCEKARQEIMDSTYNTNIHCRHLDLASMDSIREFARKIKQEESRVDVLINNAGVMNCPKTLTKDGFEMQFGVNYLGHFLLTNLLLDLLKERAHARIINLTSAVYVRGKMNFDDLNSVKEYDPSQAYYQSKLANVLFTRELAKRLEGTNVTVNCVYPGAVKTELGRHLPSSKSMISGTFVEPFIWLILRSPKRGAQSIVHAAIDPEIEKVSGKLYKDMNELKIAKEALNDEEAKRLWLVSEKWTRVS